MKRRWSLNKRFMIYFYWLLATGGLLSCTITVGSLYLSFRSFVDQEIKHISKRFDLSVKEAQNDLAERTGVLREFMRLDMDGPVSTEAEQMRLKSMRWIRSGGLRLIGVGDKRYWSARGYSMVKVSRALKGIPSMEWVDLNGLPHIVLTSAVTDSGGDAGGDKLVIMTSLPFDHERLASIAGGYEGAVILLNENGEPSQSSLPDMISDQIYPDVVFKKGARGSFGLGETEYAYKVFPLQLTNSVVGTYAVLTRQDTLKQQAEKLMGLQLLGFLVVLPIFYLIYNKLVKRTTSELESLKEWALSFSHGKKSPPPRLHTVEEVDVLSGAFSNLVNELDSALEEVEVKNTALRGMNIELEKRVEEKTREADEQRALLDTILSGMPQSVFLADANLKILYGNESAKKIFGWCPGDKLGDVLLLPADFDPAKPQEMEVEKDDSSYLLAVNPLADENQYVVVALDVTESKSLETQLLQAQKLESVGRLAGGVAHDFNNVLGSIIPSVDLLRMRLEDEWVLGYLDSIEAATLRASDVVRQLLTFSRSGQYLPRELNFNETVEGALKLLRTTSKGIEIKWVPREGLPLIKGDETQIQQMILNISLNALDAMGEKGTLLVKSSLTGRGWIRLVIQDTGPGIPPELIDVIFDPFFTTKAQGVGTGLGLFIAYGVTERHGGSITVTNVDEGGARFEILLPVKPNENTKKKDLPENAEEIVIGG